MSEPVTAGSLYQHLQEKLQLSWLAGEAGGGREVRTDDMHSSGSAIAGHLNVIHPNQIQVIGREETRFLDGLGKNSRQDIIRQLFSDYTVIILITGGQTPEPLFLRLAKEHGTPLMTSTLASHEVVNQLQYFLSGLVAERITLHGVFMEVMGSGVLITGPSSVGKSELALELISRGHRLVADDAPEFARITPDIISGSCPPLLRDYLEVRGLGVLNVRAMYGDNAIKHNKYLRLIINLEHMDSERLQEIDRLRANQRMRKVLNVDVPELTLPVAPGRNLAVLVEAAVRNYLLSLQGIDAGEMFIDRQQRFMEQSTS